jgi:predicted DCC family thiol-disulfide oxidoreductase YuxK
MESANLSIVFYDGDCGFCNQSVQFILKHRKHDLFQFIPLQSDKAKALLAPYNITISMATIYVIKNDQVFEKSTAVIKLAKELKAPYRFFRWGIIFPKFIRDGLYSIISKNRHRLNRGFCVLPTESEKKLFIQ